MTSFAINAVRSTFRPGDNLNVSACPDPSSQCEGSGPETVLIPVLCCHREKRGLVPQQMPCVAAQRHLPRFPSLLPAPLAPPGPPPSVVCQGPSSTSPSTCRKGGTHSIVPFQLEIVHQLLETSRLEQVQRHTGQHDTGTTLERWNHNSQEFSFLILFSGDITRDHFSSTGNLFNPDSMLI